MTSKVGKDKPRWLMRPSQLFMTRTFLFSMSPSNFPFITSAIVEETRCLSKVIRNCCEAYSTLTWKCCALGKQIPSRKNIRGCKLRSLPLNGSVVLFYAGFSSATSLTWAWCWSCWLFPTTRGLFWRFRWSWKTSPQLVRKYIEKLKSNKLSFNFYVISQVAIFRSVIYVWLIFWFHSKYRVQVGKMHDDR